MLFAGAAAADTAYYLYQYSAQRERKGGGHAGDGGAGKQLREAARDGDAAKVSTMLSAQGAQSFINYKDANGVTPLFFAAADGHTTVTEKILTAPCSVDLQEKNGCTPLHAAAASGHAAITKQLIAARCNVDLQMKNGLTALQLAEAQGHAGIATRIQREIAEEEERKRARQREDKREEEKKGRLRKKQEEKMQQKIKQEMEKKNREESLSMWNTRRGKRRSSRRR